MIFRRATLCLLLLGVVLGGCTDPTSIDPAVSDKTWEPSITTEFSNYRRVEVSFDDEPPLDAQRNLSRIEVQYRRAGQADYAPLDTINLQHDNCCLPYQSGPVLQEGVDYKLRMQAHFQKGSTTSDSIQFTSPVVKGQRLDTIAATRFAPTDFQFTEDNIYLNRGGDFALLRIDRATEEETVLLENFRPPVDVYEELGVHGDTLLATSSGGDEMTLTTVDLPTRETVGSRRIPPPTDGEDIDGHLIHYDGTNAHVRWVMDERIQIQVLDAGTGEVVRSYPQLEELSLFPGAMSYDGSRYWITFEKDFENRIAAVDPSSGKREVIHQNPVFDPAGLAWGGQRFWVYDGEINSFVKIKLNGF